MAIGLQSVSKPAPRWFRITKKLINNITTFTIGILLLIGYGSDSLTLLIIKLSQSFIMDTLDTFISNGEVYAQAETQTVKLETTLTKVDATENKEVENL